MRNHGAGGEEGLTSVLYYSCGGNSNKSCFVVQRNSDKPLWEFPGILTNPLCIV